MAQQNEFPLNMDAEVKARSTEPQRPQTADTAIELEAQIAQKQREAALNEAEMNPLAFEKVQRDLNYQRQMESLPQPESAPLLEPQTTPGLDRLEALQKELDAAKAEATRWKKEFGRREGKVGGMEARIKELESRVASIQPTVDVKQMTGREPGDVVTAQDVANLLMAQSAAFGNQMRQMREELQATPQESSLPLDMEAELVEAHPWLTDLPRPQKLRAMQDILANAGVTVAPPQPAPPARPTAVLPDAARMPVRQAAFIEPSNRGSSAERGAIVPERQAFNEKMAKYKEALARPGGSEEAARILASMGAGPVDETQQGVFAGRRF